jgi:hypothetical protein
MIMRLAATSFKTSDTVSVLPEPEVPKQVITVWSGCTKVSSDVKASRRTLIAFYELQAKFFREPP